MRIASNPMNMETRDKQAVAFGGLLLPLIIIGALSYSTLNSIEKNNRSMIQSYKVLDAVKNSVQHMADMEAGILGYLLSDGNERFLSKYRIGEARRHCQSKLA